MRPPPPTTGRPSPPSRTATRPSCGTATGRPRPSRRRRCRSAWRASPSVFGGASAQADCHVFVVPHQRARDPQVERATYRFIAYLVKNSADWAVAGHVPAYLPALEEPEYLALKPQSEYRSVITEVALDPQVWFAGSASRLWIEFGEAFSPVIAGTAHARAGPGPGQGRVAPADGDPQPLPLRSADDDHRRRPRHHRRRSPRPRRDAAGPSTGCCSSRPSCWSTSPSWSGRCCSGLRMSLSSVNIAGLQRPASSASPTTPRRSAIPGMWRSLLEHRAVHRAAAPCRWSSWACCSRCWCTTCASVQWLWRLSFFAPFLLPSAVVALLWLWMIYPPGFGLAQRLSPSGTDHRAG